MSAFFLADRIGRGWMVCVALVVEVGELVMERKERKDLDRERESVGEELVGIVDRDSLMDGLFLDAFA